LSRFLDEDYGKTTAVKNKRQSFLTFSIDHRHFGVPVSDVVQIIGAQEITPLPGFPHYTKGVVSYRGNVIPVIDLRIRFGKDAIECGERTCIIITRVEGLFLGFLVESVEEVAGIDDEHISPPPEVSRDYVNAFLAGIGQVRDKVILLIRLEKILTVEEFQEVNRRMESKDAPAAPASDTSAAENISGGEKLFTDRTKKKRERTGGK